MDERRILVAVEAQADAVESLALALINLIIALLRLIDPYSGADVRRFTDEAGRAVVSSRRQAIGATDQYLRTLFDELEVPFVGRAPLPGTRPSANGPLPVDLLPRGIPLEEQWLRPVKEFRRLRLNGLDEVQALLRAEDRAARMARTDVALAVRDASARRLVAADGITGWRRVIHPEVSRGGSCGLCIAAADRVYSKAELMPLHDRCACTVAPVTDASDPGSPLNRDSLNALYEQAGGTDRQSLAGVRWVVREHGELGPVLVDERHAFRGPAAVGADTDRVAVYRAEAERLAASLADLERRGAAGENVSGPLGWQRDRLESIRRLLDAA